MEITTNTEKRSFSTGALPLVLQLLQSAGFLRISHVEALVGMKKSTIYKRCSDGTFPRPLKLSNRMNVWRAADVLAWISEQSQQSHQL